MKLYWQFITFTAVGLFSGVVDFCAFFFFIQCGIGQFVALTIAFFSGVFINIWLHSQLTFDSKLRVRNVKRFLLVVGMNYVLTLSVVFVFQQLGHDYMLGKFASLPLVALHGFLWSKYWVFNL